MNVSCCDDYIYVYVFAKSLWFCIHLCKKKRGGGAAQFPPPSPGSDAYAQNTRSKMSTKPYVSFSLACDFIKKKKEEERDLLPVSTQRK
jgi:hypothetical protein